MTENRGFSSVLQRIDSKLLTLCLLRRFRVVFRLQLSAHDSAKDAALL